jgi:lipoate-protein ligase A
MATSASCRQTSTKGLMLPRLELEGPEQMALDAWLLDQCVQGRCHIPVVRFYTWPGPWLSLGHHQQQQPQHWDLALETGSVRRVRRPSGGGAVLHGGGVTYALIWPSAPRARREAYLRISQWLISGCARLGLELQPGQAAAEAGAVNCFASSTAADLVDALGHKRIGSAQFWRRGHLLQHGEVLINPATELWSDLFLSNAPPPLRQLTPEAVCTALTDALANLWPDMEWEKLELTASDWQEVRQRSADYRLCSGASSSSSPDACIDATA